MWPYWILFLIPAIASFVSKPVQSVREDGTRTIKISAVWFLVMITLALMIGLRDRVGGDWFNYFRDLFEAEFLTFAEAIRQPDPSYKIINIISVNMGLGIVGVNLFCGFVFSLGLVIYSLSMPRPWLALTVAIPYMTIVVSMGYSRQGVALGFAMIGLVALSRKRLLWFVFWIFLGATFHRSAVILVCIPLLTLNFRELRNVPVILVVAFLMFTALLEGKTDNLTEQYLTQKMQSDGALVRILMNTIPALLFLALRKRMNIPRGQRQIYSIMSFFSIISLVAVISKIIPSTALDRMNLYFIPLQVFVFSSLPDSLARMQIHKQTIIFLIILFYTAALFVWLNFANFSHWWLPYRMFPPLDIQEAYDMQR
ncbi:EpsG family protein [Shimia aestuarii]|uniref:EpsG family protein n=1 Tax=Shimia aestuarii TaxID=254406 RepID=A0A1I4Q2D1_9RHOB|nr:EpsG family protein [Shimia aestuarii]SFM34026.1 EpsG family protein [Shimia aestuarii]